VSLLSHWLGEIATLDRPLGCSLPVLRYFTVKGSTGLVVTTVAPIVIVIETPFAPFIAPDVFRLNWNCCEVAL
jgi:hypothetical protein